MDATERLRTRTVLKRNYAIMDPTGFCPTRVPGFEGCTAYIMAGPGLGAEFAHYRIRIPTGERAILTPGAGKQSFAYVLSGEASAATGGHSWGLVGGGYVYAAPGDSLEVSNVATDDLVIVVFRHPYRSSEAGEPWMITGNFEGVEPDPKEAGSYEQRRLLPGEMAFDLMVNVLSFEPGDAHPFVESHHETHGLYMLAGQGRYLLGEEWYEVRAGDYIWMGSFVPQAFICTGDGEARYLYTKEANRDILP